MLNKSRARAKTATEVLMIKTMRRLECSSIPFLTPALKNFLEPQILLGNVKVGESGVEITPGGRAWIKLNKF